LAIRLQIDSKCVAALVARTLALALTLIGELEIELNSGGGAKTVMDKAKCNRWLLGDAVRKSFLIAFLTVIIVSGLTLVGTGNLGIVHASTEVTGIITSDTTWTEANSPYVFTGPVGVAAGVTLRIEPGVTVNFGTYYLVVNGTLFARGSTTKNIFFTPYSSEWDYSNRISFMPDSNGWNEQTGSGSIIENAVFDSVSVGINAASPKINNNTFSGGYRDKKAIAVSEGSSSPIISNNIIDGAGSDSSVFSGGIGCGGNAFVTGNLVFGWDTYAISIDGGSPIVEGNVVTNNKDGFRIDWSRSSPIIRNNTIAKNSGGIKLLNGPWSVIVNNNIYDNTNYNLYLHTDNTIGNPEHDVNATYNWWGTTDTSLIDQSIRDYKDDFNLGSVTFTPFLTAPNPEAPAIPTSIPTPQPTPTQAPSPTESPTPTLAPTVTPTPSPIPVPGQSFFFVKSNSTVTELFFNSTSAELSFTVSGEAGTAGYVEVTVAKSLVSSVQDIKVFLDGDQLNVAITEEADSWLLTFTYMHSTHHVTVYLGSVPVDESQLGQVLVIGLPIAAIAVFFVVKRIRDRKSKTKAE
jgi:parallel beta-helix repeat protein